jgi:hypothetical protein
MNEYQNTPIEENQNTKYNRANKFFSGLGRLGKFLMIPVVVLGLAVINHADLINAQNRLYTQQKDFESIIHTRFNVLTIRVNELNEEFSSNQRAIENTGRLTDAVTMQTFDQSRLQNWYALSLGQITQQLDVLRAHINVLDNNSKLQPIGSSFILPPLTSFVYLQPKVTNLPTSGLPKANISPLEQSPFKK